MLTKLVSIAEALSWRMSLLHAGQALVFTNGVFDLLHAGHVEYLSRARELGAGLVIGLNSDRSVERLKGPQRPINCQEDRGLVLSALSFVDRVVVFEEDTPVELIYELRPDILVKGADYALEDIVGAKEVIAAGGRVERIPLREGRSSSSMIEKILKL